MGIGSIDERKKMKILKKISVYLKDWYNSIRRITVPDWYSNLGDEIQEHLAVSLKDVTRTEAQLLRNKIRELETKDLRGVEKFSELVGYAKMLGIDMTKREANTFLNELVLVVKGKF